MKEATIQEKLIPNNDNNCEIHQRADWMAQRPQGRQHQAHGPTTFDASRSDVVEQGGRGKRKEGERRRKR